jgi:hypothetical protein
MFVYSSVQTGSGAHPASYLMSTKESYPGQKQLECEADHSWSSSAKVKNGGASLLPYILTHSNHLMTYGHHAIFWHINHMTTSSRNATVLSVLLGDLNLIAESTE